jgi:hypothetical protein
MKFAAVATAVHGLRIGVLSDSHLTKYYEPTAAIAEYCEKWAKSIESTIAPMGRYKCDAPVTLIETMYHRFT